jgi:hypothetical protein
MQDARDIVNEKIDIENSIRMIYVKIDLAVDSDDDDFKEEKAMFKKHIESIANRKAAEKAGYFWAISEAKIHKEGSMVLSGSNDITPMMQKESEPLEDTPPEPPKGTQSNIKEYLKRLNNK